MSTDEPQYRIAHERRVGDLTDRVEVSAPTQQAAEQMMASQRPHLLEEQDEPPLASNGRTS